MNRKRHGESCKAAFGRDFAEVHDFLDGYAEQFPRGEHRKLYHHRRGIALIVRMFGDDAAKAAERHILEDLGFVPEDHTHFASENPELLARVAAVWPEA